MSLDTRWKQRFANFDKAVVLLRDALEVENPSELERAGIIQFYEVAFELAWKTLKDYLEETGITATSPRDTIKQSFQAGYITGGETWIQMLETRNELAHTYDEETAQKSLRMVADEFARQLFNLQNFFTEKL